jgi:hypothetical protein
MKGAKERVGHEYREPSKDHDNSLAYQQLAQRMYYVLEISCIEVSLLFLPQSRHAPKEPTIVFASVDTRELSEAVPTFLERTGVRR